jgi:hypothetical protein
LTGLACNDLPGHDPKGMNKVRAGQRFGPY